MVISVHGIVERTASPYGRNETVSLANIMHEIPFQMD